MKNKTKTYVLLIAVLGIWGIIAYRILSAMNPELPDFVPQGVSMTFKPKAITETDTFSIKKVERDPFLGTLKSKTTSTNKTHKTTSKEDLIWPQISYGGILKRQNSKEQIFVVTINNTQHLLKKSQQIDDVKLINGNEKSITLRYKNKEKVITFQ